MLRRFAPGYERPHPDQMRQWHMRRLFDEKGTPIDVETGLIIQPFLDTPHATISAMIISHRTRLNPFLVRNYCRQMCVLGILEESPPLSACFKLTNNTDRFTQSLITKIRAEAHRFQSALFKPDLP
jgi:hypothetical protein